MELTQLGWMCGWKGEEHRRWLCSETPSSLPLGLTSFRWSDNCSPGTLVVQLLAGTNILTFYPHILSTVNFERAWGCFLAKDNIWFLQKYFLVSVEQQRVASDG